MLSPLKTPPRISAMAIWIVLGGMLFASIWSLSFVAARLALTEVPPILLAAVRLTASGVVLLLLRFRAIINLWKNSTPETRQTVLLSGFLSQAVYLGASFWALTTIPTSVVNIVVSSLPLLTIPAAFVVLRERAGLIETIAVVMGVLGVAVAVLQTQSPPIPGKQAYPIAVALLIISVAALALGNTLIKRIVSTRNFLEICGVQFLISGLVLAAIAVIIEGKPSIAALAFAVPELAYLVFCGSILGTALWFRLLTVLTANQAASFFLLTPVMGILMGSVIFDEPMTAAKLLGVTILMSSIALKILISLRQRSA